MASHASHRGLISGTLGESKTAVDLFWWHFAIFAPTVAFKYLYVRRMSFTTGLRTILESLGDGVERYLNFLLLVTIDMLEVSILVGLLFVLGNLAEKTQGRKTRPLETS